MARRARGACNGAGVSTAAVVERVRAARESRQGLRVHGAGTWLDAGRPVSATGTVSIADDRGIVEYVPGDLTMTARGGSTLSELNRAAREHGQWLALEPWGSPNATLGATLATATAGPYAAAFGLPRDIVLGMEFVTGTGDVVRSGGRVVKNVAGFDLTRLLTGSWGTLGVITEASVRLRALPPRSRTVAVAVNDARVELLAEAARRIRALPFAPFTCELVNGALADRLGLVPRAAILMELGGNAPALEAQLDLLADIGAVEDAPGSPIAALRGADAGCVASWRLSAKPSRFAQLWKDASALPGALLHGSVSRGVVRVLATAGTSVPAARPADAALVVERMPASEWAAFPVTTDPLAESVRAKFDPDRILNPGILGGVA